MGKGLSEAEVARYECDGFLFAVDALSLHHTHIHRSGANPTGHRRIGRRSVAVLGLFACLVIAGCAQRATSTGEEQRQGGFYGGISAGNGM